MDALLDIQLLGDFRLLHGGKVLTGVDTPRLQSLLAYLLLHRDVAIPRKLIAFNYWPDATEFQAHNNLRSLFHRLRKSLPDAEQYIEYTNSWIRWRVESAYKLDVEQFHIAVEKAKSISVPDEMSQFLFNLIDLYTGDLYPGCYEDWIVPIRDQLREVFLDKLDKLIEILESQWEYQDAIRYAQKYVSYQPLQESAHRRIMRLHAMNNDRASGLHAYHSCVRVLQNELGVVPSDETRALYDQLLNASETFSSALPEDRSPFVGRKQPWQKLVATWRKQASGNHHPGLVLISGEAGIGKTRLAEEFIAWARRQGISTASANAYPSERQLAYAPVITWLPSIPLKRIAPTWLAEIARLAPDIVGDIFPETGYNQPDENWQRRRIFEALKQAIIFQHKPIILFLDDAHWADRETIEWLHFLIRSDIRERLLVILTIRKESLDPKHPLHVCLSDLQHHDRLIEINLEPLSQQECHDLTTSIANRELSVEVIDSLYRHSEGNPFFLEETLRAADSTMLAAKPLADVPGSVIFELSPKINNLLSARLDQLTPQTRAVVNIAAILGRSFTGSVLAHAIEIEEDTLLLALDELWQRRILRERGDDTYDFSHDLLRQAAFNVLSPARRQLLHRRAAEALKYVYSTRQDENSSQIAIQYDAGGLLDEAVKWYQRAARHARKVFAVQEAISHLQRGIDLIPKTTINIDQTVQIFIELGDLYHLSGKHVHARQVYERALEVLNESESRIACAHIWHKIGNVEKSALRYIESNSAFETALSMISSANNSPADEDLSTWIDIKLDQMDLLYLQYKPDEMADAIEHLNPIISRAGSPLQQSNFAASQVMLLSRQERFVLSEKTVALTRQALDTAMKSGDIYIITYKRFSLGFVMLWYGDLAGAEVNLKQSLEDALLIGHIPLQDRCLAYLCILYRLQGDQRSLQEFVKELMQVAKLEGNTIYLGVANANLAWLAYRKGDQAQAEKLALQALHHFQSGEYPFHWLALFILMKIALSKNEITQAVKLAGDTLTPSQQLLPLALDKALRTAIKAWDLGEIPITRDHLEIAVRLAQDLNFL